MQLSSIVTRVKAEKAGTDFAMLCLVAQLCLTLCYPMDCSPLGSSVHGDSPRILECVSLPSSRGSSQPRD